MDVRIFPSAVSGCVDAPVSKSVLHRALILAGFSPHPVRITFSGKMPEDAGATLGGLAALGCVCETGKGYITLCRGEAPAEAVIDCLRSASTLRFMLCCAAAKGVGTVFLRDSRLRERPVESLLSELEKHGVPVAREPLSVSGKLECGTYGVAADITSQYLSGLLMALSFTGGKSTVVPSTRISSEGYALLTMGVMRDFGIRVEREPDGSFTVDGSSFDPPREYAAEGDWSGASFMLAAGAISGSVCVRGLRPDSLQPDAAVIGILEKMGAAVTVADGMISVSSRPLRGIRICCDGIPDLVPVIAALAANASSESVLGGIGRLRYKESDRIEALRAGLEAMGCSVSVTQDEMTIVPGRAEFFASDSFADHRIAMAMAVASLRCGCLITDAGAVSKSYPGFFKDLERLGVGIG